VVIVENPVSPVISITLSYACGTWPPGAEGRREGERRVELRMKSELTSKRLPLLV
jgi:hypothetical protein